MAPMSIVGTPSSLSRPGVFQLGNAARLSPSGGASMQSTTTGARSAAHVCSHLLAPRPIVAVGRGLPEHRALFPSITARMRRLDTLVLARTEGHARQSPHDRRRMLVAEAQAKAEAARATEALTALFADALLAQLRGGRLMERRRTQFEWVGLDTYVSTTSTTDSVSLASIRPPDVPTLLAADQPAECCRVTSLIVGLVVALCVSAGTTRGAPRRSPVRPPS
jgi:hypothetical protein